MASFIGTNRRDVITPGTVSAGVVTEPGFPAPSDAADSIAGGGGADVIGAGGGDDTAAGGKGNDTIALGAGDDTILWASGDGSDEVDGGAGFDTLVFAASGRSDEISLFDGFIDASLISIRGFDRLDLDAVERVEIETGGGGDYVQISDLGDTALEEVLVAFGPGGRPNEIAFIGTGEAESLTLSRSLGGGILVDGLGVQTEITGFDAGRDSFIISLGEGDDVVDARAFSGANLNVATGSGNDLGRLGNGDDRWGAVGTFGQDTVEGGGGTDTLDLDLSIQDDVVVIAGDAAAATATRGADSVAMSSIERVEVETASGNDRVDGSGVTGGMRLFLWGGAGSDTLIGGARGDVLTGGAGDDSLTGGAGGDRFVFGAENADGRQDLDIVADFSKAAGDVLDLRAVAGMFVANVTDEGVLVTLTPAGGGDQDQILLQGLTAIGDLAVVA